MPWTGPCSNARSMNASSSRTVFWQQSMMSSLTALVRQSRSWVNAWNRRVMPSQCRLSSRTDHADDLAHALHLVEAREVHQHGEAGEQLQALGEAAEHGQRAGDVLVGVDAELLQVVVLGRASPGIRGTCPYSLSGMPIVSSRWRVGGDVHGLHVGERGEHHLDLGRLEHAAVLVVVAVLHLDVGLGEEAEDLREQVALVVAELLRPVAAVLAERHFLGHPVNLLLPLPELVGPRVFEGLVGLAGFEQRHVVVSVRGGPIAGELPT